MVKKEMSALLNTRHADVFRQPTRWAMASNGNGLGVAMAARRMGKHLAQNR